MRLALLAMLVIFSADAALADTWIVDLEGGGDFTSIQTAINFSVPGDEIIVNPGIYVESLNFIGKDLYLHSALGPEVTTIDVTGLGSSCIVFSSNETDQAVIEGFTLTGGQGTFHISNRCGGAIYCVSSSPTIRGCILRENYADYAAGIFTEFANPLIENCVFLNNEAVTYGGGIAGANAVPTIRGCLFEGNSAVTGDGTINLLQDSLIEDCVFRNNSARAGAGVNLGIFGADHIIRNCVFEGNIATGIHGGAIRVHEASPTIENCLFINNWAAEDGGAILVIDGGQTKIDNCTFYGNGAGRYGGGIAAWDGAVPLVSNSIVANSSAAGGLFCSGTTMDLICNDVWGNVGGDFTGACPDPTGTNGNISADPLFCSPLEGEFQLDESSPCSPEISECGLIGAFPVGCDQGLFEIVAIDDVGNDQGRQVRVKWQNHPNDGSGTVMPITSYSIWREVGEYLLPPGEWDFIKSVPAVGMNTYSTVCPTLCDSTASEGICWSVFFVIAHTADPLVYWDCPPDSGYSIDNLAPAIPENLVWSYPALLSWGESQDADFDYFSVYGSPLNVFNEVATLIGRTTSLELDVSESIFRYYFVTASDFSGNEGDPASLPTPSDVVEGSGVPEAYSMGPCMPNPTLDETRIALQLPEPTEVEVSVFDATGRRVVELADRAMEAGAHEITWDGRGKSGAEVSPGVYFIRLRAGVYRSTERLVVLGK